MFILKHFRAQRDDKLQSCYNALQLYAVKVCGWPVQALNLLQLKENRKKLVLENRILKQTHFTLCWKVQRTRSGTVSAEVSNQEVLASNHSAMTVSTSVIMLLMI